MLKSNMKIVSLLDDDEQNIKEGEFYQIKDVHDDYIVTTDNKKFSLFLETFKIIGETTMIERSATEAKMNVRSDIEKLKRNSIKNNI